MASGQLGRANPLATATVAIFATCGAGHAVHAEHLLLYPTARTAVDSHLLVVDSLTAVVAVTYLSLRRRFPQLYAGAEMFGDRVRAQAEAQVREAEALFRSSFDGAPMGMALISPTGTVLEVNTAFERLLGRCADALVGRPHRELLHEASRDVVPGVQRLADVHRGVQVEVQYDAGDGSGVPALLTMVVVQRPDGTPRHVVAQALDLTELRAATRAAADAADRFAALYEASPIGIAVVGSRGTVLRANPAMRALLGRRLEHRPLTDLFSPDDRSAIRTALAAPGTVDVRLDAPGQRVVQLHTAALPGSRSGSRLVQLLDISDRMAHEARLRDLADTDALTGLLNRRRLAEELRAVSAEVDLTGRPAALMVLDLDGFKLVNDSLGHAAGDELLVAAAGVLRRIAGPVGRVARIGGDEFAVLVPGCDVDSAMAIGRAVVAELGERSPVHDGGVPAVTASVGIAPLLPGAALAPDELLTQADLAVYDAKDAGRSQVVAYDPRSGRREAMLERERWIECLRHEDGHLAVYAQPIVALDGARPGRRVELLVRHVDARGRVSNPDAFLPIAEQVGLVGRIDRRMLAAAVDLLRADPLGDLAVAVNLSAQTLADPALPQVLDDLGVADLRPGSLQVEITETAALSQGPQTAASMAELRRRGCELALDDFGSGFATFDYLHRLDVDLVKVDGGFVRGIARDRTSRLIVGSIVDLARELDLPVVAEHVEDDATLAVLREMGVAFAQGHLFAAPQPAEALLAGVWPLPA